MRPRFFSVLLFPAILVFCVSCAGGAQPFASAEDAALKQKLTAELGPHTRTMNITVSGGRVYMEGDLKNKAELDEAMDVIRAADGVTSIMEDVFLTDVGPQGGDFQ